MGYQGRWGEIDYPRIAKGTLALGIGLFVLGALGEIIGHSLFASLPEWTTQLFLAFEVVGILVGLLGPILFGIALPLTE